MSLVEAYFDESGTDVSSPFLCVAGYIFKKEKSVALDIEWRKMLVKYGLPYFRMSECAHNKGVYKNLSRQDCDAAAREAIALIKAYAERGIAVSLDKEVYHLIPKDGIFNTPYAIMCWQVFYGARNWADEYGHSDDITYFFEAGADGMGDLQSATNRIFNIHTHKRGFRASSVTFIEKNRATQLQCADLLAWHWFTYQKRAARGETKKRADFKSLVELKNIDVHHCGREEIEKWLESMKTLAD